MYRLSRGSPFFIVLLFTTIVAQAQGVCAPLVARALSEVGENCSSSQRNEACYGYNLVGASFTEQVADDFFSVPSDITPMGIVEKIQTEPMNIEDNLWGVAILKLQASLPDSLPGQNVTFVLIGESEVESAVDPNNSFVPAMPINVTTTTESNMRSGPGLNFNPLGAVPANTTLSADAHSENNEWVRVAFDNKTAWVFRELLIEDSAIDDLPVITEETRMPMQAFYLRTGIGNAECVEAPRDTLMVQSPEQIKVEITVNGVNVRIGSTVLFNTPEEDILEITVLDGEAVILGPDSSSDEDDLVIEEGFTTQACLSEPQDLGIDGEANDRVVGCEFSTPTETEQNQQWCFLEGVPSDVLFYDITFACNEPTESNTETGSTGSNTNPAVLAPQNTCETFALVAPTSGDVPYFETQYSWTPVDGATQYIVNFFASDNSFIDSYFVDPTQTSTIVSSAPFPQSSYSWEVTAIGNNQILCTTQRSQLIGRNNPPVPVPPVVSSPTVSVIMYCTSTTIGGLDWTDLLTSGNLTITFSGDVTGSFSTDSGSVVIFPTPFFTFSVSYVVAPQGISGSLSLPVGCP
jgi:hypothetical protein